MTVAVGFFNNKGGVGKTTLACNFAAYLAMERTQKVVVVDCDPQANATQLMLSDAKWEEIYEDRGAADAKTVLAALAHIRQGDSGVADTLEIHESERFGVGVVAGHPSLSVVEDRLSSSWGEFRAAVLGGARRSLWVRQLVSNLSRDYDVVVFDMGPSLGALNRSVLLGSDAFFTPVAADLFSLYALENIGHWVGGWVDEYVDARSRLAATTPEDLNGFGIYEDLPIARGWAGYSVQQYVAKSVGGKIRGVQSYERYRREIPGRAERLRDRARVDSALSDLGIVPNMFSMVPLAQAAHAPISDLRPSDGVRGAQVTQRARYVDQLNGVFERLARNVGV